MNWTTDEEAWNHCSINHPSREKVQEAVDNFLTEVEAARRKYQIANIIIVAGPHYLDDGLSVLGGRTYIRGSRSETIELLLSLTSLPEKKN